MALQAWSAIIKPKKKKISSQLHICILTYTYYRYFQVWFLVTFWTSLLWFYTPSVLSSYSKPSCPPWFSTSPLKLLAPWYSPLDPYPIIIIIPFHCPGLGRQIVPAGLFTLLSDSTEFTEHFIIFKNFPKISLFAEMKMIVGLFLKPN